MQSETVELIPIANEVDPMFRDGLIYDVTGAIIRKEFTLQLDAHTGHYELFTSMREVGRWKPLEG